MTVQLCNIIKCINFIIFLKVSNISVFDYYFRALKPGYANF